LWFKALKMLGASTTSSYFMVEVIISASLEYVLFRIFITSYMIIGTILIVCGVYLTDRFYQSAI
ncbi:MAG: EamA family transporter, partial [Candidatus Njordarchaeota archaeon]